MDLDATQAPKAGGLRTALDVIAAPAEAFERLRVAPTWGWALLIAIVLYAAAGFLMTGALTHATAADWPHQIAANPRLAAQTPEQQQRALDIGLAITRWLWIFTPIFIVIAIFIQSIVMLIFKAAGRGDASYGKLWAAAANIAVPAIGLNALVTAAIVLARGPQSFNAPSDLQMALPSLGTLVPQAPVKLHAFLAAINPFTLWNCGLTIAAMAILARVGRGWAWTTGIVGLLVAAGFVAAFTK